MNSTYILVPELWIQIVLIKVLRYLKTKNEKKKFKPEKMQNLKKTVTKLLMSYIISELYIINFLYKTMVGSGSSIYDLDLANYF